MDVWSFQITGPGLQFLLPLAAMLLIRGLLAAIEDIVRSVAGKGKTP